MARPLRMQRLKGRYDVTAGNERKGIYRERGQASTSILAPPADSHYAQDLALRRKRHPSKLQTAVRLRKETTLWVKEIVARLHLGTPRSASFSLLATLHRPSNRTFTQSPLAL